MFAFVSVDESRSVILVAEGSLEGDILERTRYDQVKSEIATS